MAENFRKFRYTQGGIRRRICARIVRGISVIVGFADPDGRDDSESSLDVAVEADVEIAVEVDVVVVRLWAYLVDVILPGVSQESIILDFVVTAAGRYPGLSEGHGVFEHHGFEIHCGMRQIVRIVP